MENNSVRRKVYEKYKTLMRRFSAALEARKPASEIDKIKQQMKETVMLFNRVGYQESSS